MGLSVRVVNVRLYFILFYLFYFYFIFIFISLLFQHASFPLTTILYGSAYWRDSE